jgi:cytochrome c-type biogenesis protein CcmH/NrfF
MSLLRNSLLLALLTACAMLAQSAARLDSPDVKRVGSRLACQCGSCNSTVVCEMPGGCGYCKRIRTQIAQLKDDGKSDQAVIDQIVKENGPNMYLGEPGTWGWLAPYLAAALGLLVIAWFVRRSLRASPAAAGGPPVDNQVLDRYNERIEKDLEKLE